MADAVHNFHPDYQHYTQHEASGNTKRIKLAKYHLDDASKVESDVINPAVPSNNSFGNNYERLNYSYQGGKIGNIASNALSSLVSKKNKENIERNVLLSSEDELP